jgi:glycosyltransferase involved in cell wall biosynthesis
LLAVLPWIARSRFVYDIHELHLEQPGEWTRLPRLTKAAIRRIERWALRRSAAVITVNDAVASELRDRYGARHVRVVHNCAPRWDPGDRRWNLIREATGIDASKHVVLYHGLFSAQRGLRQIVAALSSPGLEDVHAVFLGYGELRGELERAAMNPSHSGRIHVLDAVPPSELLPWVASADVAVMPIQPETLNGYLSTPNKLFEAIAAGVPVVTSNFPATAAIVLAGSYGPIGAVCDPTDPPDVAGAMLRILALSPPEREALKARCRAAAERWNWETESLVLTSEYVRIGRHAAHKPVPG